MAFLSHPGTPSHESQSLLSSQTLLPPSLYTGGSGFCLKFPKDGSYALLIPTPSLQLWTPGSVGLWEVLKIRALSGTQEAENIELTGLVTLATEFFFCS